MRTEHERARAQAGGEGEPSLARTAAAALRLAWSASPRAFAALTALAALTAVGAPVVLWLGRHLINLIAAGAAGRDAAVLPTVVALGGLASLQRVATIVVQYRQTAYAFRVQREAEERLLARAVRIDVAYLDDPRFHDRMQRASRESAYRPVNLTAMLMQSTGYVVTLVGLVGVLTALHPLLLALTSGSVLVSAVTQRRVSRRSYEQAFRDTPEEREQAYVRQLLVGERTLKEIHAFGLEDHFLRRHRSLALKLLSNRIDVYRAGTRAAFITGGVGAVLLGLAYWFVAAEGLAGRLTPGDLFLVMSAFAQVTTLVGGISSAVVLVQEHATFLRDYFAFLDTPPLLSVREEPVPLPDRLDEGIAFEDVAFAYANATGPALDGVTLRIRPGEMVALVGENGAGKTTLVKLLLRFYDPQRGRVLVGGVDVRDADPAVLRSRFGVLFQDFQQYYLSVRDNVVLGRVDRTSGDADVLEALSSARALGLLDRLSNGLDSKVGRLFEGGHELSGGEWQRLALARLLYRDADVWVLDEPTSALDPEAEAAIFAELRENLKGRIGIVISHRFSTVRIADRIAVVEGGRITELGTHAELVSLGGRYAQLFELQAAGYR